MLPAYSPVGSESSLFLPCAVPRSPGKERDAESGADYFGARHYAQSLGRFMQPDEVFVDQNKSDPQSWNLYAYVRNNPASNYDPDGRGCEQDSA